MDKLIMQNVFFALGKVHKLFHSNKILNKFAYSWEHCSIFKGLWLLANHNESVLSIFC